MICPRCGASNRDGAAYCDSCGQPLSEAARKTSRRSAGLVGMMTFDWTMRSVLAVIFGILGAAGSASPGEWGFGPLVAPHSVGGCGVLGYTVSLGPRRNRGHKHAGTVS